MSDTENQAPNEQPEPKKPRPVIQLGMFNFVLTIGLLVFGAFSLFENLGNYSHPGEIINTALASMHTENAKFPVITCTATATTAFVGGLLLTLQGANFGFITWWAVSRMRAGKPSFWVPVIGALIASTMVFVALVGLMISDPAIVKAITDFAKASAG